MPNYGIWQEKDLALDALAADVDRDALLAAQEETLASHNELIDNTVGIFCDKTTSNQLAVDTGGSNMLQPLDEYGRPKPVKQRDHYIVGLPLWKAGTAEGYTFWVREEMSVKDFADSLDLMLKGDTAWMRYQILAPLFYNGAGLAYTDVKRNESFTVYGLANADTVVYEKSGGDATDSHYLAQANALDTSHDPFAAAYNDLIEHPSNAGSRIVAFINPTDLAAVALLTGYAPATSNIIRVVPASTSVSVDPIEAPGLNLPLSRTMTFVGVKDNTYIVTWPTIPAGYMVTVAVDSSRKPLAMRQSARPRLQGLLNIGEPMSQFPYQQNNWVRQAGFGAHNRIAAHVTYFGTSGSYSAPTSIGFPLT